MIKMTKEELNSYVDLYTKLYTRKYGSKPKFANFGMMGKVFKDLRQQLTPAQIKLVIFQHFEWRGIDGHDDRAYNWLYSNGFPLTALKSKANDYVTRLEAFQYREDWENDELLSTVAKNLEALVG